MFTKQQLIQNLHAIGIQSTDTLLVHSSYKSIGEVEGGPETLLDALIETLKDGLLIFPTHTWADINANQPVFDVRTQKPCVGILPHLFLQRPGVLRSLHPTHSVAALGKHAAEYVAGEENTTTPCSRKGCWGKLLDLHAKILFLGCPLTTNTFLHGVEEWNNIPGRLREEAEILYTQDGNTRYTIPQYRHNEGDFSRFYGKMQAPFLAKGIARQGQIGNAESYLCNAPAMAALTTQYLTQNPNLFSDNTPLPPPVIPSERSDEGSCP